jgi:hypothetical protein
MSVKQKMRGWLQRYREHRIREKAADREARERVELADRNVNLEGLKKQAGGGGGGGGF